MTRKIVRSAVRIASGLEEVLHLGNLDAIRDWGHAKDYVDGMWRILQHHSAEEWVLATGQAISVREFVEKAFKLVGITISWSGKGIDEVGKDQNGKVRIQINPVYFRPTEVPFLLGDSSKARNILGWEPKYKIDDLVNEMVESENNIIRGIK